MYKIIISIVLWPIWFCFLLFSLIIISLALYIIPKDKLFLIIRPISWLICLFAGQWLVKENERWRKELRTDIAMLVHNKDKHMDLVEVFCEPTSQLTTSAQGAGLNAERWTKEDFDLSKPAGCQAAMQRLRELRPKRLWPPRHVDHFPSCKMSIKEPRNK